MGDDEHVGRHHIPRRYKSSCSGSGPTRCMVTPLRMKGVATPNTLRVGTDGLMNPMLTLNDVG